MCDIVTEPEDTPVVTNISELAIASASEIHMSLIPATV